MVVEHTVYSDTDHIRSIKSSIRETWWWLGPRLIDEAIVAIEIAREFSGFVGSKFVVVSGKKFEFGPVFGCVDLRKARFDLLSLNLAPVALKHPGVLELLLEFFI